MKKETLAQVFCCEFFEISKNTFLHRTPLVAASEAIQMQVFILLILAYKNNMVYQYA